jgi:L-amino acid N-acyltransferase YncA
MGIAMQIIDCTYDKHANDILEILNEVIVNSTALYDYKARFPTSMVAWFEAKQLGSYPVIGAVNEQDKLMGFASYGCFRNWPAYKYTVEHAVYVHKQHRGNGIGSALMVRLIEEAKKQRYHAIIGGIDTANKASIIMHEKLGFSHCGTLKQVGFKFGRWLDLAFYQMLLGTPEHPIDG